MLFQVVSHAVIKPNLRLFYGADLMVLEWWVRGIEELGEQICGEVMSVAEQGSCESLGQGESWWFYWFGGYPGGVVFDGGEQCGELGRGEAGGTVVVQRLLRCGIGSITGVLSSRLPCGRAVV